MAFLSCWAGALGCTPASFPASDLVLVTVDGTNITQGQLEKRTALYESLSIAPDQLAVGDRRSYRGTLRRLVLDRMIDEVLEVHAAARVDLLAPNAHLSSDLTAADHAGEAQRRDLEKLLVERLVVPAVRVSEDDARSLYKAWAAEYPNRYVTIRALDIPLPAGATDSDVDEKFAEAREVAEQVRAGADFCRLLARHSPATAATCGFVTDAEITRLPNSLAVLARSATTSAVEATVVPDEEGHERRIKNVVVLQLLRSPPCPSFDAVRREMYGRAFQTAVSVAVTRWLADLRAGAKIQMHTTIASSR